MLNSNKAFTLAEVLITLGIIGVVAALTIPTLMQKTEDRQAVTGLKTAYSMLSQAYQRAVNDNGEPSTWGIVDAESEYNAFAPYLRFTKVCGGATGCFPKIYMLSGVLAGDIDTATHYKAILSNGMLIAFFSFPTYACNHNIGQGSLQNVCGFIHIDINGQKKPNVWGKDYFQFILTTSGIVPDGSSIQTSGDTFDTACKTGNGYGCAAWVIQNENRDYLKSCKSSLSWTGNTKCD
ncbi:type II secretion system protein [bacterium]|nr:type II secretion system protein [bacterium]